MSDLGFERWGMRIITDCRMPADPPNQATLIPTELLEQLGAIDDGAGHTCTPEDRCDAWVQAERDGKTPTQAPYTTTPEQITVGQKRRLRQNLAMHNGRHPLLAILGVTNQALHPAVVVDVPLPITDARPTVTGPTCGDCEHRKMQHGGASDYPKCFGFPGLNTHGESSDVRAWWPACHKFEAAK